MRKCSGGLVLAGSLLFGPGAVARAEPRPMRALDLLSVATLGDPQLSPDGRQILFTRSEASWKTNRRVSHVHRVNADGSGLRQMTSGLEGEASPRWAPEGSRFVFLAKRGDADAPQLYLQPNDGGEARALTRHASAVSNPQWAPDGSAVYFLAAEPKTAEEKARETAKDDVLPVDEDYKQVHLWRVSVPEGVSKRVTEGNFSILQYTVSRDGKRVAHVRTPTPLFGDAESGEVYVMDADGGNAVRITTNELDEFGPSVSPDGSQVLFVAGANEKFEGYRNGRVFAAPTTGGTPRLLLPQFPHSAERAIWSRDGKSVIVAVNLGVHNELFLVDVASGRFKALTEGAHEINGASFVPERNQLALVIDEPTNPGEVWLLGLEGKPAVQVTHLSESYARDFKLTRQERVEWKGADGVTVDGILFYPVDYVPGQRYPLVVQTHGGPRSSDRFGFGDWQGYVQVLAGHGYAVLQPNYRGSTGYGDDFMRDMVGHYFKNAHLDVMAGVDAMIAKGIADPDRLAKMGWSAGGHMTNKIITFTDRFKAASSGAGGSNFLSLHGQSDTRSYRRWWFGGTPWQKDAPIDVFWEGSPLKYAANVKTPTLFLVGEKDVRVPPAQSQEMYRALKSNGVPTKLYIAPREPHTWNELRHQLFKINVELDWFEKYVRGRDYVWEKAPEEAPRPETPR